MSVWGWGVKTPLSAVRPQFETQLPLPRASYLSSLKLSFFVWKVELMLYLIELL